MSTKYIFLFLFTFLSLSTLTSQRATAENEPITFSKESGFYNSQFQLTLTSSDNSKIYYTTDGSDPTKSSTAKEYSQPIQIKDRSQEPNVYSAYTEDENSATSISRGVGYKKPPFNVDKAMVIRAASKSSEGYSQTQDKIYFITSGDLAQYQKYTVVSLITNPENLFDAEKGIYVTGNQYLKWKNGGTFNPGKNVWDTDNICNYFSKGKEWERDAHIMIFEKGTLSFEETVGIRIKGSSTRNLPEKSFNIYPKNGEVFKSSSLFSDNVDIKGKKIETYESFTLRSVSEETRLRDKMSLTILKDRKGLTSLAMKSAVLFLDGEYWGLYTMMENISGQTFANHYNIPKSNLIVSKENKIQDGDEGEIEEYKNFVQTILQKDLTNENNYNEICKVFDIDSMIEHYVAGIYLATFDWPDHNYGLWKSNEKIEGNEFSDGKWRFITYDLDYTLGATYDSFGGVEGYQFDMFKHMERVKSTTPTNLFFALLKNESFKKKFVEVVNEYANDVVSVNKMNKLIQEYKSVYPEMVAGSQNRWWGYFGGSEMENYAWAKNNYENTILSGIQTFIKERGKNVLEHMKKYLNL